MSRSEDKQSAMTMGQLAALIRAVRMHEHGHHSPVSEKALSEFSYLDLTVYEWMCRLIPNAALQALEKTPDAPLWGTGAGKPETVHKAVVDAARRAVNYERLEAGVAEEPELLSVEEANWLKGVVRGRMLAPESRTQAEQLINRVTAPLINRVTAPLINRVTAPHGKEEVS